MDAADKLFRRMAQHPPRTPVLTELPPGYSNWRTEADMEREIEQLRSYVADLEEAYRDLWQIAGGKDVIALLRDRHGVADLLNEDAD